MTNWTDDELATLDRAVELRVAGLREDGTLRKLVLVGAVRVGDSIYIRSLNGPDAAWFRGTQVRGEGRIESGGIRRDVTFTLDTTSNSRVDAAYRAKFGNDGGVAAMTRQPATSTTLRVDPR